MANSNGCLFFVSSLPVETTAEDLKEYFSPRINLTECKLTKTLNGIKSCHGYIRTDCNENEMKHYIKNKQFQKKQLEIDVIEEVTDYENKNDDTTNKKEKRKKEMIKEDTKRMNLYRRNRNNINENKYIDGDDANSIASVNIINENGNITKYGYRIIKNMNMYDVVLLIERIQSLIRACPQTAIKLLTEHKTIFYSLVHALFLLGILNIEISPLNTEELKKANFLKIKNRFQYLFLEDEEEQDTAESLSSLSSDENQEKFDEQKKNKRAYESFEEITITGKKDLLPYNKKAKKKEYITETSDADNYSFDSFTQGYELNEKDINRSNIKLKDINDIDSISTSNDSNNNINNIDVDINYNSNICSIKNNIHNNNNINNIEVNRNNNANYIIMERAGVGNVSMNKTGRGRNLAYNNNNTNNSNNNNNDTTTINNNNDATTNTTNSSIANNYCKGVYSFNTNNIGKKYKQEEHKSIYKMNDTFNGENEFFLKKKNNSNRPYSNKSFINRDYGTYHYGDINNNYDGINYKNNKSVDYVGNLSKHGGSIAMDPFVEKSETDKNSMSSRNVMVNKYGNSHFNENEMESLLETGGESNVLKKSIPRNMDNRKYISGLYKKKINKSIINHNKSINRVSVNNNPPSLYNNCYNNKKSKTVNNTFKNINMSINNVHEVGPKVTHKGKYKEIYGGKFKNKITNYTNNGVNFVNEQNTANTKNCYDSFYNTEEGRNQSIEFGNEICENSDGNYNINEKTLFDKGSYGNNKNIRKGHSSNFTNINNFSNQTNFNNSTNFSNLGNFNKMTNLSNVLNTNNTDGNSGRNFNTRESDHHKNNFGLDSNQIYNQNNNNFNDTKNIFFNIDNRRKEGNELNNSYNKLEIEKKHKMENLITPEFETSEIKDINKEDFSKNKFTHFNQIEEEKKNRKNIGMFQNAQSNYMDTFSNITENNETYYKSEEKKEHNIASRKDISFRQDAVSRQSNNPKQGVIKEIKKEEKEEKFTFCSLMKNDSDRQRDKEELHMQLEKKSINKNKTSGNVRRCIKLIDRKSSNGSNKESVVKVKSIELIEKKNPLIRKKKEQPLINSHLKLILNKLKIALGAIPNAPDDLVNEVINENTMLNNIIKSKYEDMLKWPNEQILRVLSIRKVLKQRGYPITDII